MTLGGIGRVVKEKGVEVGNGLLACGLSSQPNGAGVGLFRVGNDPVIRAKHACGLRHACSHTPGVGFPRYSLVPVLCTL